MRWESILCISICNLVKSSASICLIKIVEEEAGSTCAAAASFSYRVSREQTKLLCVSFVARQCLFHQTLVFFLAWDLVQLVLQ